LSVLGRGFDSPRLHQQDSQYSPKMSKTPRNYKEKAGRKVRLRPFQSIDIHISCE